MPWRVLAPVTAILAALLVAAGIVALRDWGSYECVSPRGVQAPDILCEEPRIGGFERVRTGLRPAEPWVAPALFAGAGVLVLALVVGLVEARLRRSGKSIGQIPAAMTWRSTLLVGVVLAVVLFGVGFFFCRTARKTRTEASAPPLTTTTRAARDRTRSGFLSWTTRGAHFRAATPPTGTSPAARSSSSRSPRCPCSAIGRGGTSPSRRLRVFCAPARNGLAKSLLLLLQFFPRRRVRARPRGSSLGRGSLRRS